MKPQKTQNYNVTYTEHLVHHFDVEATSPEEAEALFRANMENFDFSDGELYDSEIEVGLCEKDSKSSVIVKSIETDEGESCLLQIVLPDNKTVDDAE